jgi:hypothetical protein
MLPRPQATSIRPLNRERLGLVTPEQPSNNAMLATVKMQVAPAERLSPSTSRSSLAGYIRPGLTHSRPTHPHAGGVGRRAKPLNCCEDRVQLRVPAGGPRVNLSCKKIWTSASRPAYDASVLAEYSWVATRSLSGPRGASPSLDTSAGSGSRHLSWHRHIARSADDRLRVRCLPLH